MSNMTKRGVFDRFRLSKTDCLDLFGWLMVATLTCGCNVGPRYRAPTAVLNPLRNAPSIEVRTTTSRAPELATWWQGFNDPLLSKLVFKATAQNLDLAGSLQRVVQARASAKLAGARLLPRGSLNGQSTSYRQSLDSPIGRYSSLFPTFDRNQSYLDLGVAASWEIDVFGGLKNSADAASYESQAAEADRLGVRVVIVAETADAYMQIRGTQLRLRFAREQIATDDHLLGLVQQRRTAGIASDRELAQAEALLLQAKAAIPLLDATLAAQLNRLDVLLGEQPGTNYPELSASSDIPVVPAIDASSLVASDMLRRRPDIIAAERRIAAANARIGVALAEYYPKFSLSALIGNEAISPGDLFRARGFQPQGIGAFQWRLFDFGRVDAEVKQAKAADAESLLSYRAKVLSAVQDIENSLNLLVESESRTDQVIHEIAALQRVRDRSNEAYQAGVIGLTDVLDADRQLLVARDDLAQSREAVARSAVASFRALGGGWTP